MLAKRRKSLALRLAKSSTSTAPLGTVLVSLNAHIKNDWPTGAGEKKTQLGKMIDRFQNERPALG